MDTNAAATRAVTAAPSIAAPDREPAGMISAAAAAAAQPRPEGFATLVNRRVQHSPPLDLFVLWIT